MVPLENACLREWREELLAEVYGDVLEIGAGTGANIDFYPSSNITLVLAEPNEGMRKQLQEKVLNPLNKNISITSESAENINAENESFDFVVSSLVCCSVSHLESSLLEIKRVLKHNGRLVLPIVQTNLLKS